MLYSTNSSVKAQHSQAQLESEARAVAGAEWRRLGDEGIKIKWPSHGQNATGQNVTFKLHFSRIHPSGLSVRKVPGII